jgi:preprotein translocase subunit YajC
VAYRFHDRHGSVACNTEGEYVLLAEEAASNGGSGLLSFLPIIAIVVLMYFLLIRPQNKRRREAQELQSRLSPGDEVQTMGGMFGTVVALDDEAVSLEVAPDVVLRFGRGAIGRVIPKPASDTDEDSDTGNSDAAKTIEQG